ncbi:MAG: flippase [Methanobacterium sp.]|nr:flippase [Methanobacterium sp.]
MSTVQRLAKNIGILTAAQIITYILGFYITLLTARYLGVEGLGIIAAALALTSILGAFGDLGLSTLLVREVSRDNSLLNKYLSNILVLKILLILLVVGLTFIAVFLKEYDQIKTTVIYIIIFSVIIGGFTGVLNAVFQSHQKMEYLSIGIILNSVLMLIGTFLCIFYGLNIVYFAILYVISNVLVFLYTLIIYVWHFSAPKFEFDLIFSKKLILLALPLSLASIFALIAFKIDIYMLDAIMGSISAGYYSASYNLLQVFIFLPIIYTTAIFPVFSSFHVSSMDSLKYSYHKSFKYLMILSLPISVGTTILANQIIILVYKNTFEPSIYVLQILIWAIPFLFLNYILSTILTAMDKQNLLLKITFISMIFNILLNLLIIPTFNYLGAALVTILTEFLVFGIMFYIINKIFFIIHLRDSIMKPIIASIIMGVFLILVKSNLFIMILLGAIVYFIVLFALKTFDADDFDIIKLILNR